jgi:hypothetical protein
MAMNMFDIAMALGHRPTIETFVYRTYDDGVRVRQKRYIVKWPKDRKPCISEKSEEDSRNVYRKVVEVEKVAFEGKVFNLEVDGDHSYAAKDPRWEGVFTVTEEDLVSSDIVGNLHGAIADLQMTRVVGGNLVKVMSWYDNEMGYTNTLVKHVVEVSKHV